MCERREISRRSNRPATRYDGEHTAVETVEQELDGRDARAGIAFRERVCAQQHRGAHDLVRIRLADPARVRAKQPQLQLAGQLFRDPTVDEPAEAGVDAVRGFRGSVGW